MVLTHAGSADTLLVLGTGSVAGTGRVTYSVVTEESGRTVVVPLTGCRDPVALHVWLPGEAWGTGAHPLVVDHVADGVEAARQLLVTQVGALTSLAGLRQPALPVALARRCTRHGENIKKKTSTHTHQTYVHNIITEYINNASGFGTLCMRARD